MAGLVPASRIILKHWKTAKCPDLKDWVSTMVENASHEFMLNRLNGNEDDEPLGTDWTQIRNTGNPIYISNQPDPKFM